MSCINCFVWYFVIFVFSHKMKNLWCIWLNNRMQFIFIWIALYSVTIFQAFIIIVEQLHGRIQNDFIKRVRVKWNNYYFYGERVFASTAKQSKPNAYIKLINLNKFTLFDVIKSTLFQFCRRCMRWVCSFLVEFMEIVFLVDTRPVKLTRATNSKRVMTVYMWFDYTFWSVSRIEKQKENHITHKLCLR